MSAAKQATRPAVLVSADGIPPLPALVDARVGHRRLRPKEFSFGHRVQYWLVDVDRLPRLPRWLRSAASFDARDHFAGGGIRKDVDALLAGHGIDPGGSDRIVMLTLARSAGYVFNPISVYWCFDGADELVATVLEVHNTYGKRHAYVLTPERSDDLVSKELYVSPFNNMEGAYRVRARLTDVGMTVSVALERDGELVFAASVTGRARPATNRAIALSALRTPLASYRVSALIRFHGIRLWLRRLPIQPEPGKTTEPRR